MQDLNLIMSTVIVIGVGPTPREARSKRLYAPGLRLWNFLTTLLDANHEPVVIEARFGEDIQDVQEEFATVDDKQIRWYTIAVNPANARLHLRTIFNKKQVDAIVSTTEVMNSAVASCNPPAPTWLDFNGDPMAERQMQAAVYGSDKGLLAQWEMMLPALLYGDHFSTCSEAQRYALIGQLSACGRLNKATAGHDLVDALPPGAAFLDIEPASGDKVIRDNVAVNDDDFVLLWSGGYNTWTDVDTLFKALDVAMSKNPRIHYVSTGGTIEGHDERTFERFRGMVQSSEHAARFHFKGWVELAELRKYYHEADAAINIDSFSYEAVLGCRNRIFDWLMAELPVITTAISEVTRLLADKGLVTPFQAGNADELRDILVEISTRAGDFREKARRARTFMLEEYTNETLLAPLVEWVKEPRRAPDRERGAEDVQNRLATVQKETIERGKTLASLEEKVDALETKLGRIQGSRLFQILNKLKKF